MRTRTTLFALAVLGATLLAGGMAQAADNDTIAVTVSLLAEISVTVAPDTWNIGAITLSSSTGPETFTATVGNCATKLEIKAADGAGGWTLAAAAGSDEFEIELDDPAISLTTAYQELDASVAAYGNEAFDLTYKAPTADTIGAGVAQGFNITVKGSTP